MNLRNLLSTILVSLLLVSIFLQPQQLLNASTNSVAPREKTDFVFRIDPDGQVSAKGSYEGILDSDSGPIQTLEASLSIDENKEVSSVVVELSPEAVSEFPFNTSTVSLAMDYANNLVTANLNASTRLPVESASQFPFNSTDLTVKGKYLVGDLNLLVDATIDVNLTEILQSILPLIGFNQSFGFPMVMNIHYSKGNYDGTIVLHLLPGFPIGDLETSVTGNLTDIRFSGTVNVIYMNYLGTEINSTFIDMIEYMAENVLNASIDTPNSLLNMTEGQLSCPYANIERENITGGEGIAFDVRIHGDFVAIFAQMLEPLWESGFLMGNIPTWMQVQRYNFTYMLLNDTLHKIQNTDLEVSYTPVDTKCLMTLNLTLHIQDMVEQITEAIISGKFGPIKVEEADFLQAINSTVHDLRNGTLDLAYVHNGTINLKAFLAADVKTPSEGSNLIQLLNTSAFLYFSLEGSPIPESIDQPINELMNKTFVEVTSTHQKLTYSAGTITYTEEATYTGDINAEANYIKSVVLKYFNLGGEGLPWQAEYINQTWLGVAGADLNLNGRPPRR